MADPLPGQNVVVGAKVSPGGSIGPQGPPGSAASGSISEGIWNFDAANTDTSVAPVSGRFKTNSGTYRGATQIAIHGTTIQGVNRADTLRKLLADDIIECQDSTNGAAWCRYRLQSPAIDNGAWFQLNVALQTDGGVASGDNQEITFVFTANNVGAGGGTAEYRFDSATAAPPSSGNIRCNNASMSATTVLYVHNVTVPGSDIKRVLNALATGTALVIQDQSNSANYAKFAVSGATIDQTTYTQIPVTYTAAGGTIGNNTRILFAALGGSSGGGGAPTSAEYITSSADATLTAERVLTNTATVTWDFSTPGQAKATAAPLPTPPTRQVFTTVGAGTYNRPSSAVVWLEVELQGGGGGGQGGSGGAVAGSNTTFGPFTAGGGGVSSSASGGVGGPGGTASGGQINLVGASGISGTWSAAGSGAGTGGAGGSSPFGGAGTGAYSGTGGNAAGNTGSGGGGGGCNNSATTVACAGGSAGGYVRGIINNPASTYSYSVGAGGTGGSLSSGTNFAGGNGGSGIIIVTEHYGS